MTVKSKRMGFTWDQEYKYAVDELKASLKGFGELKVEPSNLEIFLLCLAFGQSTGTRRAVPPRKTDGPRFEVLGPEHWALVKSVALAESESSSILLNEDEAFDIVEEFAAGGLMLLAQALASEANFQAWILSELLKWAETK
jgi:hypothetical protein